MRRLYETFLQHHFQHYRQMLFLAGPRQVGKTTLAMQAQSLGHPYLYLNWDNQDDQQLILQGPKAIIEAANISYLSEKKAFIVFDEIHKYPHWKNFLKGFFDKYQKQVQILVTGSSRLDIYRAGGDSLMGRYLPCRVHPLSVAECIRTSMLTQEIHPPHVMKKADFERLLKFGGFPEPFIHSDQSFLNRWRQLRHEQLFREDIRDLSQIRSLSQLSILAELLRTQAGQLVNYSNLANKIRVSADTVRRWIDTLSNFYYCFVVPPWSKNVSRSLLKEPKIYLYDWSNIEDIGQRAENFIASHLLKAIHFWTDQGLGEYGLYFLRDKEKREVDFLVTKDRKPWFLVEVKNQNNTRLSPHLALFQKQIKAKHAFQVILEDDFINADCFALNEPVIVPALTFLSQLI